MSAAAKFLFDKNFASRKRDIPFSSRCTTSVYTNMFQFQNNSSARIHSFCKNASSTAVEDDYRRAISALNSLQSNRNAQKDGKMVQYPPTNRNTSMMFRYLAKCGIEQQDLEQKLSVIHVSGTKGKGSTCAYCESILRQYGYKTGFFSSPHLCSVRERIRINGEPLSREKFVEYFWGVYEKLKSSEESMPSYFMFLTVLAFKVFYVENIDVGILEVGIGGEYDCTNILSNTAVVGISSLGYDHVQILGKTIEEIAWQKAGIIKRPSVVVTAANQPTAALQVLQSRAAKKSCPLYVAPDLDEYESDAKVELGIRGAVQKLNAALALQLVNAWMNSSHYHRGKKGEVQTASTFTLSKEMVEGLRTCSWPGRTQILQWSTNLSYYLDGAHTDDSIQYCLQWFEQVTSSAPSAKRVLVFNMIGDRDTKSLLKLFLPHRLDLVCFCTNRVKSRSEASTEETWSHVSDEEKERAEQNYRDWLELKQNSNKQNTTVLLSSVDEVHEMMQKLAQDEQFQVLVTGSLHLVGAFLRILNSQDEYITAVK